MLLKPLGFAVSSTTWTLVNAFWRMGCSNLEIGRLDPVVQPGIVSNHVHTIVGGSSV
jgi:hypothetical protein